MRTYKSSKLTIFLNSLAVAKSILRRGGNLCCALCNLPIKPGDTYRQACSKSAHETCFKAAAQ